MSLTLAVWLLLVLAVVAANLPWLSERFLFVFSVPGGYKSFWMRLIEWLLMGVLVGLVSIGLERKATGGTHGQDWEFYAVGLFLFMVFAIPGFIWRYQWLPFRRRGQQRRTAAAQEEENGNS